MNINNYMNLKRVIYYKIKI